MSMFYKKNSTFFVDVSAFLGYENYRKLTKIGMSQVVYKLL